MQPRVYVSEKLLTHSAARLVQSRPELALPADFVCISHSSLALLEVIGDACDKEPVISKLNAIYAVLKIHSCH